MRPRSRLLALLAGVALLLACATFWPSPPKTWPGVILLEAQTLPVTKTLAWDANAASEAVINYLVTQDGVTVGSPVGTTQPVTFTTVGPHTLTVVATNLWGVSAPATLVVTVVLPTKVANLRLQ